MKIKFVPFEGFITYCESCGVETNDKRFCDDCNNQYLSCNNCGSDFKDTELMNHHEWGYVCFDCYKNLKKNWREKLIDFMVKNSIPK